MHQSENIKPKLITMINKGEYSRLILQPSFSFEQNGELFLNLHEYNIGTVQRDDLVLVALSLFSWSHGLWDYQKSRWLLGYFLILKKSLHFLLKYLICSVEHEVFMVSCCDWSMAIMRRA